MNKIKMHNITAKATLQYDSEASIFKGTGRNWKQHKARFSRPLLGITIIDL
jgi:hypothetical protein